MIGNSLIGTVGADQDTLITPRLPTGMALTVPWLGNGGSAKALIENIIVSQHCHEHLSVMYVLNMKICSTVPNHLCLHEWAEYNIL